MAAPAHIPLNGRDDQAVAPQVSSVIADHHYSPEELGKLWNLSADTIRRLFEHEPGVLVIARGNGHARRYRTLRIPESVAARVHRRLSRP
jgi:hypothetical protein